MRTRFEYEPSGSLRQLDDSQSQRSLINRALNNITAHLFLSTPIYNERKKSYKALVNIKNKAKNRH